MDYINALIEIIEEFSIATRGNLVAMVHQSQGPYHGHTFTLILYLKMIQNVSGHFLLNPHLFCHACEGVSDKMVTKPPRR